jgi:pimeloyl-ACP methyl ester carboxylesterase
VTRAAGPAVVIAAGLLLGTGCTTPITAKRADAHWVHRKLTETVLTTGKLSQQTRNLLFDRDLIEQYEKNPAGALAALHAEFVAGTLRPGDTASLAELAYHHAEDGGGRPYYLATALYAWDFLFPADAANVPSRLDPRVRLAADLYNRGLSEGFESQDGKAVSFGVGTFPLPFGTLEVTEAPDPRWSDYELTDFVPIAEYDVEGFPTYYRWPGLGAPLAASVKPVDPTKNRDILAPRVRVPLTLILRPADLPAGFRDGRVRATLESYPGFGEETVRVGDRDVPLEAEPTAALGFSLSTPEVWGREISGFLRGFGVIRQEGRLVATRPYRPGLIPVVFVHGTASSAARWAQLFNELTNDPRIFSRYQFWFFSYETGNAIPYSAMLLREALANAVAQLDPEGKDPALRQMVVIGHSQGGLLTKCMVVEPGNSFWANISDHPLDELGLPEKTADLLRRALLFHPSPFVRRVVFVATPHHGSYVAGSWYAHQFARLIRAPLDITKTMAEFATVKGRLKQQVRGAPTAVDNMTPGNPFVKALSALPIVPGVTAHSIIAVKDMSDIEDGDDGVVKYKSAHIEGVESEFVVHSPHSCQGNPRTIAEVRRILLLHLGVDEPVSTPGPS